MMAGAVKAAVAFFLTTSLGRVSILLGILFSSGACVRCLLNLVPRSVLAALFLVALVYVGAEYIAIWRRNRVKCFMGTGNDLQHVYGCMPSARDPPRPPLWCFGGYTQFVPWLVYNMLVAILAPLPFESEEIEVKGLLKKTQPESEANPRSMVDKVVVHYFPAVSSTSGPRSLPLDAPALFIDPGLTCTAQDVPGSSLMRRAHLMGIRVVVIERRGHHGRLGAPRFNIFGDSDDSEQIYNVVAGRLKGALFFWVGLSSGSKLVIEGLGKFDKRRAEGDASAPRIAAAACICPGYNLETCFKPFQWPFSKICLASAKDVFVARNEEVLRRHDPQAFDRVVRSPCLQTMLAAAAPFAGFESSQDYFAHENPVLFVQQVTTPTLVLNVQDDPMTVVANAFAKSPFHKGEPTFVDLLERSPCGMLLISSTGSHCPFLDGYLWPFERVPLWLGGVMLNCWAERCALEFFQGYAAQTRSQQPAGRGPAL